MTETYTGPPPPFPLMDALTEPFWQGASEGKLMIQRCQKCGFYVHPPRPVCRDCLSMELAPEQVSGRGELYTWVIVEQAFQPFFADKLPYVWALVELVEQPGLRVVTNVIDCPHEDLRLEGLVALVLDGGAGALLERLVGVDLRGVLGGDDARVDADRLALEVDLVDIAALACRGRELLRDDGLARRELGGIDRPSRRGAARRRRAARR